MQKVQCAECGRTYDYDEDAFCPKCGAFNQPARGTGGMRVVRRDGISEAGHDGSFLHQEYHEEERKRRRSGLDKSVDRSRPAGRPAARPAGPIRPTGTVRPRSASSKGGKPDAKKIIKRIVIGYFALIFLVNLVQACAYRLF